MYKSIIIVLLFFAGVTILTGQEIHRCGTHDLYLQNAENIPHYEEAVRNAFDYAKNYALRRKSSQKATAPDTIYRIPVVVHVVYNTPDQNIEDSLIYNQIEVLNQDYRRLNPDTANTRSIFKPIAADAGIEFYLAQTDPDGMPTNGITRDQTTKTSFSLLGGGGATTNGADEVKLDSTGGVDAWDTKKYLNIWVCNLNDPSFPLGTVLGFSYPPDDAPNWPAQMETTDPSLHGVVIHYEVFGRNNPRATGQFDIANRGRTATHEVGHYLGLRHIWGDGPLSILFPDCSADDGIEDTPNSGNNSQAAGCDTSKNTCTDTSGTELPDMFENYMDYSREECQNLFTQGQVDIMRAMLATSRVELPDIVVVNDSTPPVGITQLSANEERINVYPNPSDGIINVEFDTPLENVSKLTIHNVYGKSVKGLKFDEIGYDHLTINLKELSSGIYFIKVNIGESTIIKKVVLQ